MPRRSVCWLIMSVAAIVVFGNRLWAHPGHGVTSADEPVHVLVEPIHGWPILVAIGVAILAWRRFQSPA